MKNRLAAVLICIFLPAALCAQRHAVSEFRLLQTVNARTAAGAEAYLSAPDAYGTPLVLKLARQGDVQTLVNLANSPTTGQFLLATDKYGNNLFHVAKNADTVQAVASLLRRFYGARASQKIIQLANARNQLGEAPLNAQINAAHTDTFRPIYAYTVLKQKNDTANNQLARLRGADVAIFNQHKAIYCAEVIAASSAGGKTLLQSAQAQIPYHPDMAPLAQTIVRTLPCLTEN